MKKTGMKWMSTILALFLVISLGACSNNTKDAKTEEPATVEESKETQENEVTESNEETSETKESEETDDTEGPIVTITAKEFSSGEKLNVSADTSTGTWYCESGSTAYFYNVADKSESHSAAPRIQVEVKQTLEKFDFYIDKFENLQNIEGRTIGGIEMTGRTYKNVGMEWTEYLGQFDEGFAISVKISRVDIAEGTDGAALLDSMTFSRE
ncbi:hypothetical protein [Streptococcus henryi]|uniref:hypothetical protein n=1 Tax=Streptococcus henryi TaxID=439219 RepID=UPI00036136B3|nr:hypothetical protein [Streptococcus henryi]